MILLLLMKQMKVAPGRRDVARIDESLAGNGV
jgi:hypothetical protein